MSIENPTRAISRLLEARGHHHFGITQLSRPVSLHIYQQWIESGYHGEMNYLKEHLPQKQDPTRLLPEAKSAIVIGFSYLPHPEPQELPLKSLTALYAQGADYHHWIKAELEAIVLELKQQWPNVGFLVATDSRPVLERDLAYRAGLGWIGKNTCLIHEKKGSLFLIGEILTSLDIDDSLKVHPDRCGTCTRCLEACPTDAFVEPRKLDARKCISFLTIESKTLPPLELRHEVGRYFFGCDICQTVCPWNQHQHGEALTKAPDALQNLEQDLKLILTSSGKALEKLFSGTPLTRASKFGHVRNAMLVIARFRIRSLREAVRNYEADPRLGELATWTLAQLDQKIPEES